MPSGVLPSDLDRDDDSSLPAGSGPDAADLDACLDLLERVRERSGPVDADWIFGSDTDQSDHGDTEHKAAPLRSKLPRRIGRFEVVGRLGRGGYGIVLLAVDPELNRQVAVKVPSPEVLMNDELQQQFLREGKAAAALNHPQIVTVHEAGQIGALHYIASEYVAGGTLAEWLKRSKTPLDPSVAARLIKALADAVQHAHGRGVLHRDIKPGNILVDHAGGETVAAEDLPEAARLADFGLASIGRAVPDTIAGSAAVGTPAYMSPEQAEGRSVDVDATSDVYALGVILYEFLVGATPFKRGTRTATLNAIRQDDFDSPQARGNTIPTDLEAICLKCLRRTQAERYPTASALADDLQRFIDGDPVSARPQSRLEHVHRWCRRNPTIAALVSLVTLLFVVVAVGSSIAAMQLAQSRRQTLDHLEQEIRARDEATRSEELALRTLFTARIAQARAGVRSGGAGQRLETLDAVAEAAALIPRLELPPADVVSLRNEAVAAMSLVDLSEGVQWETDVERLTSFATDTDVERYAAYDPETATILVRSLADDALLAALPQNDTDVEVTHILFSPDGRHLVCVWDRVGKAPRVQVWDLDEGRQVHFSIVPNCLDRPFDFDRDGQRLAVGRPDGSVQLLRVPAMAVLETIPGTDPPESVRFSPDGSRIAIQRQARIELVDAGTGEVQRSWGVRGRAHDLAWSENGMLLAAAHGGWITVWRTATGVRDRSISHSHAADHISFHPDSAVLASSCRADFTTRLWDVNNGRQLLTVAGESTEFSRDGTRLGRPAGRWNVAARDVHRSLLQPLLPGAISAAGIVSVHPDGRLAAASNRSQTIIWDLAHGLPAARIPMEDGTAAFSSTGDHLIVSSVERLMRRPIVRTESETGIHYRLGPAESLAIGNCGGLAISADGAVITCVDRYHLKRITLHNARTGFSGVLTPAHDDARWIDLSAPGHLIASSAWSGTNVIASGALPGTNVQIWDAATGELRRTIPSGNAKVQFSPDGTKLAIDEGNSFRVLDTKDWREVLEEQTKSLGSLEPGTPAFSPDGHILAVPWGTHEIRLLDTRDYSEITRFVLPHSDRIEDLTFSGGGDRLLASARGHWGTLHVWDLLELRKRLAAIGLDWDHLGIRERADESKPVRVMIDASQAH